MSTHTTELSHEPKLTPGADQLSTRPYQRFSIWTLVRLGHTLKYHLLPQKGGSGEGAKASAFCDHTPHWEEGNQSRACHPEKEERYGAPLPGLARQELGSSLQASYSPQCVWGVDRGRTVSDALTNEAATEDRGHGHFMFTSGTFSLPPLFPSPHNQVGRTWGNMGKTGLCPKK